MRIFFETEHLIYNPKENNVFYLRINYFTAFNSNFAFILLLLCADSLIILLDTSFKMFRRWNVWLN